MKRVIGLGGAAVLALALSGCDGKSSAVAPRDASASASSASYASSYSGGTQGGAAPRARDPRDLPVPQINGKPLWAANRNHTAEENAEYQFTKNGGDFGASSETDYVTKVHAFIERPPQDIETLDRPNGDKLLYDPGANVFAVVARNGAPRTMFKPRAGGSYWDQQKDREAKRAKTSADGGQG